MVESSSQGTPGCGKKFFRESVPQPPHLHREEFFLVFGNFPCPLCAFSADPKWILCPWVGFWDLTLKILILPAGELKFWEPIPQFQGHSKSQSLNFWDLPRANPLILGNLQEPISEIPGIFQEPIPQFYGNSKSQSLNSRDTTRTNSSILGILHPGNHKNLGVMWILYLRLGWSIGIWDKDPSLGDGFRWSLHPILWKSLGEITPGGSLRTLRFNLYCIHGWWKTWRNPCGERAFKETRNLGMLIVLDLKFLLYNPWIVIHLFIPCNGIPDLP